MNSQQEYENFMAKFLKTVQDVRAILMSCPRKTNSGLRKKLMKF